MTARVEKLISIETKECYIRSPLCKWSVGQSANARHQWFKRIAVSQNYRRVDDEFQCVSQIYRYWHESVSVKNIRISGFLIFLSSGVVVRFRNRHRRRPRQPWILAVMRVLFAPAWREAEDPKLPSSISSRAKRTAMTRKTRRPKIGRFLGAISKRIEEWLGVA